MKKRIIILSALIVLAACVGGCVYWWYYNNKEIVCERYLFKYTPPVDGVDYFSGGTKSSSPKTEIKPIKFVSDSAAIKSLTKRYTDLRADYKKDVLKSLKVLDKSFTLENTITYNAYLELYNEEWYVFSIYHTRSFDYKKLISVIKKEGLFSGKVKEYADKNGVEMKIYHL